MNQSNPFELVIPDDFPRLAFRQLFNHLQLIKPRTANHDAYTQLIDAWNATIYRFYALCDHDDKFRESIDRMGPNPTNRREYYFQEKEIFEFFVNGHTVIESFYFGCYMLGSTILPTEFPISSPKAITPNNTVKKYRNNFKDASLSALIESLLTSKEYGELSYTRNILTHRLLPARLISHTIFAGEAEAQIEVKWNPQLYELSSLDEKWHGGKIFDGEITGALRRWLATTLEKLVLSSDGFVLNKLDFLPSAVG